jgi:uncharacterized protein
MRAPAARSASTAIRSSSDASKADVHGEEQLRVRPLAAERKRCKLPGSSRRIMGYQRWDEILFVHWPVPASVVRPLVDSRLTIDTFESDQAWISATPFTLVGGRLRGLPPLPRVSTFHELNLRTYVHLDGREPGIWFFSLDCASALACVLARAAMALPYHWSDIERSNDGNTSFYECRRRRSAAFFRARWSTSGGQQCAPARSLQDFLLNRFRLYTRHHAQNLVKQAIWHEPWRFYEVDSAEVRENIGLAAGLPRLGTPVTAQFSTGVDVEFYFPQRAQ